MNSKILGMVASLVAATALLGCLPDGSSVSEKSRQSYLGAEANKYASSISSYSATVQNTFLSSSAWQDGTMTPGLQGYSDDESMASAYCVDTSGGTPNHMLIAWMTGEDGEGRFAMKGMGDLAGPQIVRALGSYMHPQNTGIHETHNITLSGPRSGGGVDLALPGVCANLDIPGGAPVVLFEGLSVPTMAAGDTVAYDYRTVACDDPQELGGKTQRREITTHPDGTQETGNWSDYTSVCREDVGERSISISGTTASAISMQAFLSNGDINGKLSGLASMDCRESGDTSELPEDAGEDQKITVNTCDAEGVTITKFEGLQEASLTGAVDDYVEITTACGAGSFSALAGSYSGYAGTVNPGTGWQGTATYERVIHDANIESGGTGISSNTGERDVWRGKALNCTRNETMNISCYTVLPAYNGGAYTAQALGGYNFQRTNRINGWANPVSFEPNASYGPSDNWTSTGVNCRWLEQRDFTNCAAGLSPDNTGRYNRQITAIMPIGGVNEGAWASVVESQCSDTESYEDSCPDGEEGSITYTTTTTSTAQFPWSTPVVDSYTDENYNCEPIEYEEEYPEDEYPEDEYPEDEQPEEEEECAGDCHDIETAEDGIVVEWECDGGVCESELDGCDLECVWNGTDYDCVECCD